MVGLKFNLKDEQKWLVDLVCKVKSEKITPMDANKILLEHIEAEYFLPMSEDDPDYFSSLKLFFPKDPAYLLGIRFAQTIFINNKVLQFIEELAGADSEEFRLVRDEYFDYVIERFSLEEPLIYSSKFSLHGYYPKLSALYRKLVAEQG